MPMIRSGWRTLALTAVLLSALTSACDDSPSSPRGANVVGEWIARQQVTVPDCGLGFTQDVPLRIESHDEGDDHVTLIAEYGDLGACSLSGTARHGVIDAATYRCFPFGLNCSGHPVECRDGRRIAVCDVAIWIDLHATLGRAEGVGTASAWIPVVDAATGELESTLRTDVPVAFRRESR